MNFNLDWDRSIIEMTVLGENILRQQQVLLHYRTGTTTVDAMEDAVHRIQARPHVQAWLSWSERGTVNP